MSIIPENIYIRRRNLFYYSLLTRNYREFITVSTIQRVAQSPREVRVSGYLLTVQETWLTFLSNIYQEDGYAIVSPFKAFTNAHPGLFLLPLPFDLPIRITFFTSTFSALSFSSISGKGKIFSTRSIASRAA